MSLKINSHNQTQIIIPADVPESSSKTFMLNYATITHNTNNLFLFAADQKIEHLNEDFYGPEISSDALDPEHIFNIAQQAPIGALAVHPGLIARYAKKYNTIHYIAKLNGKTNLVDSQKLDPISEQLWTIDDILIMKSEHNISLCGIGYTLYIGSEFEHYMLKQAAQVVMRAHARGLVAILWVYPRAQHIKSPNQPNLIADATGIANALGADFVKVHVPSSSSKSTSMQALKIASKAAGNTGVICSGGSKISVEELFHAIYDQIHEGNARGCAIGRNIFQRPLAQALAIAQGISAITYNHASVKDALTITQKTY